MPDTSLVPEILDDLLQGLEPFPKMPDQSVQDEVDELMEFLGFTPGTLHYCTHTFPWIYGNLEDPEWLGQIGVALGDCILYTEPNEPFLYIDCLLLRATYGHKFRKSDNWMYKIKVMVRDKIAYFPIPIADMTENSKYLFKEVFRAAQTEEI